MWQVRYWDSPEIWCGYGVLGYGVGGDMMWVLGYDVGMGYWDMVWVWGTGIWCGYGVLGYGVGMGYWRYDVGMGYWDMVWVGVLG